MPAYHPDFERALERLLLAAADSAEFADELPQGRSRTASLRRLRDAVRHIHEVSARLVLEAAARKLVGTARSPTG